MHDTHDGLSRSAAPLLVCAPGADPVNDPVVVLADGSYETTSERVFWRSAPDEAVLRLPLSAPVAVRPVRVPHQAGPVAGESALLAAVHAARRRTAPADPAAPPPAAAPESPAHLLTAALRGGDASSAVPLAVVVRDAAGLPAVVALLTSVLAEAGQHWSDGTGTVLAERRTSAAAQAVVAALAHRQPAPTRAGLVVLASPPGDRHELALQALALLVRAGGHDALVVGDLPREELLSLAADAGTSAVVLSAHLPLSPVPGRQLLSRLRGATPGLLAVGGPGLPEPLARHCGADVVGSDPAALLAALDRHGAVLTDREREVLQAVADGLTNAEIARLLGVAPATVKSHLDRVFAKTGTVHRAAAVARALRAGWIR